MSSENPYEQQPSRAFWRTAVSEVPPDGLFETYKPKFDIGKSISIAAAGSCFAQHIGKQFKNRGYNFLDVEPPPGLLPAQDWHSFGFDLYSGRYGNVYSIRQLLQMFRRAFGRLEPCESVWETKGRFYDPFRPSIEPNGFVSAEEVLKSRNYHFLRLRRILNQTDLFVFTFGLTEAWICTQDNTVLPTCPGTVAGSFDPAKYHFHNFSYSEVLSDAQAFIKLALAKNPNMKFLFTVSPVPLTATATDQHVLVASVHSKSVLRAVAGELYATYPQVDYFPSFELIASHPSQGRFFAPNMRNVTPQGVEYAMNSFFSAHEAGLQDDAPRLKTANGAASPAEADDEDTICDEEILEAFSK